LLYTDGLTESQNPAGEMFTHDRLSDWLRDRRRSASRHSAEQLRDELVADLAKFRGGSPLRDDQAFVILSEQATTVPGPLEGERAPAIAAVVFDSAVSDEIARASSAAAAVAESLIDVA
jgi:hypothetical protein